MIFYILVILVYETKLICNNFKAFDSLKLNVFLLEIGFSKVLITKYKSHVSKVQAKYFLLSKPTTQY